MDLRRDVLQLLEGADAGLDKRQIVRELGLDAVHRAELKAVLRDLLNSRQIIKVHKRKYRAADRLPPVLVVHFFQMDDMGDLIARPKEKTDATPLIRLSDKSPAGQSIGVGDTALVRLTRVADGYDARVIKKFDRQPDTAVPQLGKVHFLPEGIRIQPTDKKARSSFVLKGAKGDLQEGDLVRFLPVRGKHLGSPVAEVEERIGSMLDPKAASLLSMAEHGIVEGFSPAEEEQAETAKPIILGKREDLRDLPLITIDPEDARDFDDAVLARPDDDQKNKGGWVVWVAIADVAHYVTPESPLDVGARKRGNSVYLPDRVVPMLPERLSADLCSLRPDEDRACMAVEMVFDAKGHKRRHRFTRGLMRSRACLTYAQAQAAHDGNMDETTKPLWEDVLRPLWHAYSALKIAWEEREPLHIETDERRVRIGEDGKVTSITLKERFEAHKLIEICMVLANVCAAETLESKKQPFIYRVHAEPDSAKVHTLADFLRTLGMKWAKGDRVTTKRFNRLLAQVHEGKFEQIVNDMVLRTQMRAIYDPHNIGHFGLSLQRYTHFTSPIRRYADLTVHRALIRALNLGEDGATDREVSELSAIAEHITMTERAAMATERDAVDRYMAAHMADQIGAIFAASITGVTRFGLFLSLEENGADGLVPVRTLGDEYFQLDEAAHALIGRDTGGRYRLGHKVSVRLREATPLTGGLLFEMLTPPVPGPRPNRRNRVDHSRKHSKDKNRGRSFKRTGRSR